MNAEKIIKRIQKVYIQNKSPFVVGYSGGKDSTAVLDLTLQALYNLYIEDISIINKVTYILTSDTLVENPFIISLIDSTFESLEKLKDILNLKLVRVIPKIEESFWVSIIGKGYPLPLNRFRWCTRQLKVEPMKLIMNKLFDIKDGFISVLGIRFEESSSRKEKMDKNSIEFSDDMYRSVDDSNSIIFAPINDIKTSDLWRFLLKRKKSIWGLDYAILYEMYWDTSKECPMALESSMIDDSTLNCGSSRWGCWICPMSSTIWLDNMVNNGLNVLKPLADFRKWLIEGRDNRTNRYLGRHTLNKKNGEIKIDIGLKGLTQLKRDKRDLTFNIYFQPKKGIRKKIVYIKEDTRFIESSSNSLPIIHYDQHKNLINSNLDILFSESGNEIEYIIDFNDQFWIPAMGPYTMQYRFEILFNLIKLQNTIDGIELGTFGLKEIKIVNQEELDKIFDFWLLISKKINKYDYIKENIRKINKEIAHGNKAN